MDIVLPLTLWYNMAWYAYRHAINVVVYQGLLRVSPCHQRCGLTCLGTDIDTVWVSLCHQRCDLAGLGTGIAMSTTLWFNMPWYGYRHVSNVVVKYALVRVSPRQQRCCLICLGTGIATSTTLWFNMPWYGYRHVSNVVV